MSCELGELQAVRGELSRCSARLHAVEEWAAWAAQELGPSPGELLTKMPHLRSLPGNRGPSAEIRALTQALRLLASELKLHGPADVGERVLKLLPRQDFCPDAPTETVEKPNPPPRLPPTIPAAPCVCHAPLRAEERPPAEVVAEEETVLQSSPIVEPFRDRTRVSLIRAASKESANRGASKESAARFASNRSAAGFASNESALSAAESARARLDSSERPASAPVFDSRKVMSLPRAVNLPGKADPATLFEPPVQAESRWRYQMSELRAEVNSVTLRAHPTSRPESAVAARRRRHMP